MKTFFGIMNSRLLALIAAFALTFAQGSAQAQPAYSFSQQELDRIVAPIALYPDALLSQILMAATYPLEVAEAARWVSARPGLSGDDAVRAAEPENWDPSVKSLVAFPQVLTRMDEDPQWTRSLGDAFLDQQEDVMDTVQALRRRAQAAGSLRSDDRVTVVESGSRLLLQPFDSRIVYVPYYDPLVVYGSWWWPSAPPVYWRPWPGYYAQSAYARGFYWGPPIGVSAGFFFGTIDWRQRHVKVTHVDNHYYKRTTVHQPNADPQPGANRPGAWRLDPGHRRGLAYRSAEAPQRVGAASAQPAPVMQAVQPAPLAQPKATADTRFHRRRDTHGTAQAVQPAPIVQPVQPAPVMQPAQPAPAVQPMRAGPRFDHRGQARTTVPAAPAAQPAPVLQAAPIAQPAAASQAAAAGQAPAAAPGNRQAARRERGARHEPAQAGARAAEDRPGPAPTRQDPIAVPRGRASIGRPQ